LELIVVLLILGILAAIAIPTFNLIQQNSVAGSLTTTGESIVRNANAIAASEMTAGSKVSQDILDDAIVEALGDGTTAGSPGRANVNGWTVVTGSTQDAPTATITLESGNVSCALTIAEPTANNDLGKVAITIDATC